MMLVLRYESPQTYTYSPSLSLPIDLEQLLFWMASREGRRPEAPAKQLTVGLLGNEKKFRTFFASFAGHCAEGRSFRNLIVRPLIINASTSRSDLTEGGGRSYPAAWDDVDVLLHKLSDDIAAAGLVASEDLPADGTAWNLHPVIHEDVLVSVGSEVAVRPFYSEDERIAARSMLRAVTAWVSTTGANRIVFEPLSSVSLTTRRTVTQRAVSRAIQELHGVCLLPLAVPFSRLVLTPEEETQVLSSFDHRGCHCLVKSDVACGKSSTHHMRFVLSQQSHLNSPIVDNSSTTPTTFPAVDRAYARVSDTFVAVAAPPFPRIIQRAVYDAAAVIKVYAVGDYIAIRVIRNGIPWIPRDASVNYKEAWFSSQNTAFFPVEMESVDIPSNLINQIKGKKYHELEPALTETLGGFAARLPHAVVKRKEVIHAIIVLTHSISHVFGLFMFGFDLAIGTDASTDDGSREQCSTPTLHILDVNYFPGYKGIDQVNELVGDLLLSVHEMNM